MNVKHGTRVLVTVKDGNKILSREKMPVEDVGGHLTVQSFMLGGAYNQSNWQTSNGRPPRVTVDLVDPTDELIDGALCDCVECLDNQPALIVLKEFL